MFGAEGGNEIPPALTMMTHKLCLMWRKTGVVPGDDGVCEADAERR